MSFFRSNRVVACIAFLFCISYIAIGQQDNEDSQSFSVLFYNIENLFDTIASSCTNDSEFTPQSEKQWNTRKYYKKLHAISKVIIAAGAWNPPDIIAFAEVESPSCTRDILSKTALSKMRYSYIHHESPDRRGIDVSLAYNPKTFIPLFDSAIAVTLPDEPHFATRDILYVKGIMSLWNDTLHVFALHFPSRFGGAKKSEYKRIAATNVLISCISDIYAQLPSARIIVMGDFNDTPKNKAPQFLAAACSNNFIRLSDSNQLGTNVYKNMWHEIDQCYVSVSLHSNYTLTYSIISFDFMLQTDSHGRTKPFRTYAGPYYLGGYSDHLPILCRFQKP
ncbi:MAG: endonuclease [Bacteroidales bacterium]|nr:endonuclease [Bacteroidales bacterium]NLK81996.1 endonuclease [Bacteroidales bacterium]